MPLYGVGRGRGTPVGTENAGRGLDSKPLPMITFRDTNQTVWQVFQVVPHSNCSVERRRSDRRRGQSAAYTGPERRSGPDRRHVSGGLDQGWLCFVAGEVKYRLFGFPPEWSALDDQRLEDLLSRARRAPASTLQ